MIAKYHPTVAGCLYVSGEDGHIKAAAHMTPSVDEGAERLYFEDSISLMHLCKMAQSRFPEGRLFISPFTSVLMGSDRSLFDSDSSLIKYASGEYGLLPTFDKEFQMFPTVGGDSGISPISLSSFSKDEEMEMWKRYKNKNDRKALSSLVRSYRPMMKHRTKAWTTNSPLPKTAVEAEGNRLIRMGIDTYDPKKGAALNTHVWNYLTKIHRYGYTYQNVGSIPEPRAAKVGLFQNTFSQLEDKYNREPTAVELEQALGWKASEVNAMQKELRSDLDLSGDLTPIMANNTDPAKEALFVTYYDAAPERKLVMEYTFDEFEQKPTEKNAAMIGSRVGISPDKVRRHHRDIASNMRSILDTDKTPIVRVHGLAFSPMGIFG